MHLTREETQILFGHPVDISFAPRNTEDKKNSASIYLRYIYLTEDWYCCQVFKVVDFNKDSITL